MILRYEYSCFSLAFTHRGQRPGWLRAKTTPTVKTSAYVANRIVGHRAAESAIIPAGFAPHLWDQGVAPVRYFSLGHGLADKAGIKIAEFGPFGQKEQNVRLARRGLRRRKHSPFVRWVMSGGPGSRRGHGDRQAGAGGCQGLPVNRSRRTVRMSWPCLRAVSM